MSSVWVIFYKIYNLSMASFLSIFCVLGPPILVFNGRVYRNNSIIPLQDIGPDPLVYNASVYCYTTHSPCCTTTNEGNWFIPRGINLNIQDNYVARFPATRTVNLYRPTSSFISGLFRCKILDGIASFVNIYVGIYQQGLS